MNLASDIIIIVYKAVSSRQELTGVKIVQANARLGRFCVFSVMDTCTESEAPLPTYVKQAIMKVPYSNRCMACLSRREGANENKHLRCTCSNELLLRLEQTCILWEADADYYILHKQVYIHLCVYIELSSSCCMTSSKISVDFFLSTCRKDS